MDPRASSHPASTAHVGSETATQQLVFAAFRDPRGQVLCFKTVWRRLQQHKLTQPDTGSQWWSSCLTWFHTTTSTATGCSLSLCKFGCVIAAWAQWPSIQSLVRTGHPTNPTTVTTELMVIFRQNNGGKWKSAFDMTARKETRGLFGDFFFLFVLFFNQHLNSGLYLSCLRGPIPQYLCRSFTGTTLELKACSTEKDNGRDRCHFLWYTIITQVGRRLAADCQEALLTDFLKRAKKASQPLLALLIKDRQHFIWLFLLQ